MTHNPNPLRIRCDTYQGYKPYLECPLEAIYAEDILPHPIFADYSCDYRIGFEIPDNRYFCVLPEPMDVDALYSDHWQRFVAWARGRHPDLGTLPAAAVTVAVYITEVARASDGAEARIAAETIHTIHRWASMSSPFNDRLLQKVTGLLARRYPPVNSYASVEINLSNPAVY